MDQTLAHFIGRFFEPFNTESRFYWPFVVALLAGIVANVVWYYTRTRRGVSPGEVNARPWAVWANLVTIIWCLLVIIAKAPFLVVTMAFLIDAAVLVYLYGYWLPPREAAWQREMRRQRYIPQGGRRRDRERSA